MNKNTTPPCRTRARFCERLLRQLARRVFAGMTCHVAQR